MCLPYFRLCCNVSFIFALLTSASFGQGVSDSVHQQIQDVLRMKASWSEGQRKVSSDLLFSIMAARNIQFGSLPKASIRPLVTDSQGLVLVDVKVNSVAPVLQQIGSSGGQVVYSSDLDGTIRTKLPYLAIESIANLLEVQWIRSADAGATSSISPVPIRHRSHSGLRPPFTAPHLTPFIGALTSQGYITHTANQVLDLGFDGTGVRVGVLSDSASASRVAALINTGDLPSDVVIVPGQVGSGADEGTAMMEIVHDLAPGAKLFFATSTGGQSRFANNIRTLRFTYGCDIIVDDYTYFAESAFQDGIVAKAVNDVVADGALYFSDAQNSGNLTSGTSGTWEGDFRDGGAPGSVIDVIEGQAATAHNFGTVDNPQLYDTLTGISSSGYILLQWSDPIGGSSNDYDFFILDSAGTTIKGFSATAQTGTQDPLEQIVQGTNCGTSSAFGYCPAIGDRLVVVLHHGSPRALHIDTERGRLAIGTSGATFSHNAGANTVTLAATAWNSAHLGTQSFTGFANPVEIFSSDGPRQIFYNPDGTAITPGNYLFETNGGVTLQKPDLTAADGVFTKTPGFLPFFGTSAAAPHAAAIAALVKSVNPGLTNAQIKSIMTSTALDTMAPGADRDSGYGITMALPAVQAALGQ